MKELERLILTTEFQNFAREINQSVRLGHVKLIEYEVQRSAGVWVTGNCIIAARETLSNKVEVALIVARREEGHTRGSRIVTDSLASVTWSTLVKFWSEVAVLGERERPEWTFPLIPYHPEEIWYLDEAKWKEAERQSWRLRALDEGEREQFVEEAWLLQKRSMESREKRIEQEESLVDQTPEEVAEEWLETVRASRGPVTVPTDTPKQAIPEEIPGTRSGQQDAKEDIPTIEQALKWYHDEKRAGRRVTFRDAAKRYGYAEGTLRQRHTGCGEVLCQRKKSQKIT